MRTITDICQHLQKLDHYIEKVFTPPLIDRRIPTTSKGNGYLYLYNFEVHTAWKVLIFRVFLVRIFPHLDWIQKDTPNLSSFSQNAEKYAPEKLRIWTLFRHCWELFYLIMLKVVQKLKKYHRIFDKIIFRTIHRI